MKTVNAARRLFIRFIITNLLILLPLFLMASVYYAVSLKIILKNLDAVATAQLSASVASVDRKLSDIKTLMDRLVVDYELNRLLNEDLIVADLTRYDSRRISEKLSSLVLGGEIMSRCFVFLTNSNFIIYESGYSDYDSFYGPLFELEAYSSAEWKNWLFSINDDLAFLPNQAATVSGKSGEVHLLIRPIGYGTFRRGLIVGVIDQVELGRRLARLPELYGGLVMALDAKGQLLASSSEAASASRIASLLASQPTTSSSINLDGILYRVYRLVSPINNWTYIALAEERNLSADAVTSRSIAFLLLGIGAFIGFGISFLAAFNTSRPIVRLFSLLSNSTTVAASGTGVYETVEKAILRLTDDNRQLVSQVTEAARIAELYFFETLLRGDYRERLRFIEDRKKLAVTLSECQYYVIVCRSSSLAAALGDKERLEAVEVLWRAAERRLAADEHMASLSFGELILIKRWSEPAAHEEVAQLVSYLKGQADVRLRGSLVFGIGRPVDDPFLLPLSYGEALTALARNAEHPESLHFYVVTYPTANTYHYPFEVEESLVKAVRAANSHLMGSILASLRSDNFVDRSLTAVEARNFIATLRGTVRRLIDEAPELTEIFGDSIQRLDEEEDSSTAIERFAILEAIFQGIVAERKKGKRSHNEQLGQAISRYITTRYADHNLGLTSIADTFGISESYLSAFFKEQTGECLSERILRVRLSAAAQRLKEYMEPVNSIAKRCGYSNATSFRRAFKRHYGVSPSEYRSVSGVVAQSDR